MKHVRLSVLVVLGCLISISAGQLAADEPPLAPVPATKLPASLTSLPLGHPLASALLHHDLPHPLLHHHLTVPGFPVPIPMPFLPPPCPPPSPYHLNFPTPAPPGAQFRFLLIFDTDNTVEGYPGFMVTRDVIRQTLAAKGVSTAYAAPPVEDVLEIDRTRGITPKMAFDQINDMFTCENEVIFIYIACRGGPLADDYELFATPAKEKEEKKDVKDKKDKKEKQEPITVSAVVSALKKKRCQGAILVTDACLPNDEVPVKDFFDPNNSRGSLSEFLASRPRGSILHVQTAPEGKYATMSANYGSAASWGFSRALTGYANGSWDQFLYQWESESQRMFQYIKKNALGKTGELLEGQDNQKFKATLIR